MKRNFVMLVMSLLLIILVACSENDNKTVDKSLNSGDTAENTNTGTEISGELELQYFVGGYGDSWWKEVISEFEKEYPNVKVIENSGPNINKEMQTRWISGNPPDLVYLGGADMNEATMVSDDLLMDLTDWYNEITLEDDRLLSDKLLVDPHVYNDNQIYSLPYIFDTWGIWYDKNWFEQEDFIVPKNFDEWLKSMKEIKDAEGISPFTTTGMHPYYFLNGVLHSGIGIAGGDELLADIMDGVEGAWSSPEVLKIMDKIERIRDEELIDPGFAGINHTQSQMNFLNHKNAYIPVGFFLPNEMKEDVPEEFDFGFIPPPLNDPDEPLVLIPETGTIGIAKDAKNPEAAKSFAEFIYKEENAIKLAELAGGLPNLQDIELDDNPNVSSYLKDVSEYVNNPEEVQLNYLSHKMDNELRNPIMDALVAFLLGDSDVNQFIEDAEKAAEQYRNN